MNKTVKIILPVVLLAAILVGAYFGYQYLSGKYEPEDVTPVTPAEQNTAADFEVLNSAGYLIKLSDRFGKPIIINFWATWCGPCCMELPYFDKLSREYGDKIDFMMVNLTDGEEDTVDSVNDFMAENGYSFPLYYDVLFSAYNAYHIMSIPMTVAISADGNVIKTHIGTMSEDAVSELINELI